MFRFIFTLIYHLKTNYHNQDKLSRMQSKFKEKLSSDLGIYGSWNNRYEKFRSMEAHFLVHSDIHSFGIYNFYSDGLVVSVC